MPLEPTRGPICVQPPRGQRSERARVSIEPRQCSLHALPIAIVEPLAVVRALDLRRLHAEHIAHGITAEYEDSLAIELPDPVACDIDDIPEPSLRHVPCNALGGLPQCAPHRRGKPF